FPETAPLIEHLWSTGIVHDINTALESRLAEIASALERVRNTAEREGACLVTLQIFVIDEEERFVVAVVDFRNGNWPTERETKVILAEMGFPGANRVLVPGVGVEHVIEHVFVHAAMVGIRAGLGNQ